MGTKRQDGEILSVGGRVLMVIANAPTLDEARRKALIQAEQIDCPALFHRNDIGAAEACTR